MQATETRLLSAIEPTRGQMSSAFARSGCKCRCDTEDAVGGTPLCMPCGSFGLRWLGHRFGFRRNRFVCAGGWVSSVGVGSAKAKAKALRGKPKRRRARPWRACRHTPKPFAASPRKAKPRRARPWRACRRTPKPGLLAALEPLLLPGLTLRSSLFTFHFSLFTPYQLFHRQRNALSTNPYAASRTAGGNS
jgi:hypothetical protein